MKKSSKTYRSFTDLLTGWHRQENTRQMPWKGEKDPYKIWLSEIILQQTRVAQGLPYYNRFIQFYPTVKDLAQAPDTAVFKLWEGLGYYSRCRNLLACARQVVQEFGGSFPADYEKILSLKGIGPYTAAAIASFAWGLPHAVVDGNVIRVLSRYFGIDTPYDSTAGKKQFAELAGQLLDRADPAAYNQAIMDFGAVVCKPGEPDCPACPLKENCVARLQGLQKNLPVKGKKLVKKDRYFTYAIVRVADKCLVRCRAEKDIWQNLHDFYLQESDDAAAWQKANPAALLKEAGAIVTYAKDWDQRYRQQLTHQNIHGRFVEIICQEIFPAPPGYDWISESGMADIAFPRIINSYLADKQNAAFRLF